MAAKRQTVLPHYLEPLERSLEVRKPGEIFAMKWRDRGYFFGRVVSDKCSLSRVHSSRRGGPRSPQFGVIMVYVYRVLADSASSPPALAREDLLIPPVLVNNLAWKEGYFVTVGRCEIVASDILPQHCFWRTARAADGSTSRDYCDQLGRPLDREYPPARQLVDHDHVSIETEMAANLGLYHPRLLFPS